MAVIGAAGGVVVIHPDYVRQCDGQCALAGRIDLTAVVNADAEDGVVSERLCDGVADARDAGGICSTRTGRRTVHREANTLTLKRIPTQRQGRAKRDHLTHRADYVIHHQCGAAERRATQPRIVVDVRVDAVAERASRCGIEHVRHRRLRCGGQLDSPNRITRPLDAPPPVVLGVERRRDSTFKHHADRVVDNRVVSNNNVRRDISRATDGDRSERRGSVVHVIVLYEDVVYAMRHVDAAAPGVADIATNVE